MRLEVGAACASSHSTTSQQLSRRECAEGTSKTTRQDGRTADELAADPDAGHGALARLFGERVLPVGALVQLVELVDVKVLVGVLEELLGAAAWKGAQITGASAEKGKDEGRRGRRTVGAVRLRCQEGRSGVCQRDEQESARQGASAAADRAYQVQSCCSGNARPAQSRWGSGRGRSACDEVRARTQGRHLAGRRGRVYQVGDAREEWLTLEKTTVRLPWAIFASTVDLADMVLEWEEGKRVGAAGARLVVSARARASSVWLAGWLTRV